MTPRQPNFDTIAADRDAAAAGALAQPISHVEWVSPSTLRANGYNPNKVFPPELALLKVSLMESGWTQPVVTRTDDEIVDGFHRWSLCNPDSPLYDAEVAALTGGLVPRVKLRADMPMAEQMMATVRHNRARGEHGIAPMSEIVRHLHDVDGLSFDEIGKRLGMEEEEVDRLYDSSGMPGRGSAEAFNKGWVPR